MARRLNLSNKKLRGIPRRIRSLKKWSEHLQGYFPEITNQNYQYGYWNAKIPVDFSLVQGKYTNKNIQSTCAQYLIDAAYGIYQAKPSDESDIRVTCCIIFPDMFSSEVCLFTSDDYFNEHTQEGYNRFGHLSLIQNKSLVDEWNLILPEGFSELGILRVDGDEDGNSYYSEHWYLGEVKSK